MSEAVRNVRSPQLERMRAAWSVIEWRSVSAGLRPCAFLQLYSDAYAERFEDWRKHGLQVVPLRMEEKTAGRYFLHVAVGAKRETKLFKDAWMRNDHDELGKLLGYPECCRRFFRYWFEEKHLNDPSWLIARNTTGAVAQDSTVGVHGDARANILLRYCGLRAVPHLPCRFDCAASREFAERLLGLYPQLGYAEEATWLIEALDWPVEWSALHGIAEVRTPVMKLAANTDAVAGKFTIQWMGNSFATDAVRGLGFPYDMKAQERT